MPTCTSMFSNTSFELSTCFPHVAVREQIDSDDEENASFESIVSDNSDPEYEPHITGQISSEDNSDDDGEAVKKKKKTSRNKFLQSPTQETKMDLFGYQLILLQAELQRQRS